MSLERSQVHRSQRKRHAARLIRAMAKWDEFALKTATAHVLVENPWTVVFEIRFLGVHCWTTQQWHPHD